MRFLFLLYCLLISCACAAQEEEAWAGFGVETNVFEGQVIKHTAKFKPPIPKLSTGVDINFQFKTYGRKEWEQRRRYPIIGIGFTYTNYGIDSVYGRCFSLYPNITIPLIRWKKLEWTLRIGDGVGYVTKHYSRFAPADTINNAIGSHLNDFAFFTTDLAYHFNDHWGLQIGGNFSHISNASFHQPNLGVNMYGTHIGIKYFPVTSTPKHIVRNLKPLKNRWLFQIRMAIAFQQEYAPDGPTYPVYIGAAYLSKRWLSKNKFFAGVDYNYNKSVYAFLRNNPVFVPAGTEAAHAYKTAAFAGNEFLLGRVGVVLQLGYYLHQAYEVQGAIYEKLGGNLYLMQREKGFAKEFFISAYLKAHLFVAEYAEVGLGMGF